MPLSLFAATPLPLPSPLPPLQIPPTPHPLPRHPAGAPVLVWTAELIESLNLSSTVALDLLSHLPSSLRPFARANQARPTVSDVISLGSTAGRNRRIKPTATALGTSAAVNDI